MDTAKPHAQPVGRRGNITPRRGYRRFPDGNKAPDILLKLAITLRKMDQTQEACATLGELGKKFTDLSPPLRNRMQREVEEAACP